MLFVRVPFGGGLVRYGFITLFFTEKSDRQIQQISKKLAF